MTTIFDCCDSCGATLTDAEKAAGVRFGQELCDACAAEVAAANPGLAPNPSGQEPGPNVYTASLLDALRRIEARLSTANTTAAELRAMRSECQTMAREALARFGGAA